MPETNTKEPKKGEIIIYKTNNGPEIEVNIQNETIWATQADIARLFEIERSVITKHIRNVFKTSELSENSVCAKFAHTASDGKIYQTQYYNLDLIISVGYRVNSKKATLFRAWATQKLRELMVKGYVVYEEQLKRLKALHNADMKELEQTAKLFRSVLDGRRAGGYEKDLLNIITDYAEVWSLLHQYDGGMVGEVAVSRKKPVSLSYEHVAASVEKFRERLAAKKMAGDLFGREVGGKLRAVLGSIGQTFDGKDLYPSVEAKAAHLLYFMIKDHPFADGNKRIGSLAFMLFLVENNYLLDRRGERKFNDNALAALALLVAESSPSHKEIMVRLIMSLVAKK